MKARRESAVQGKLPAVMQFVADQALFLRRMSPGQGSSLGIMAGCASLFFFNPVAAFLHCLVEGAVPVIKRDRLNLLPAGAHDEQGESDTDNRNRNQVSFSYLHQLRQRLLQIALSTTDPCELQRGRRINPAHSWCRLHVKHYTLPRISSPNFRQSLLLSRS